MHSTLHEKWKENACEYTTWDIYIELHDIKF